MRERTIIDKLAMDFFTVWDLMEGSDRWHMRNSELRVGTPIVHANCQKQGGEITSVPGCFTSLRGMGDPTAFHVCRAAHDDRLPDRAVGL